MFHVARQDGRVFDAGDRVFATLFDRLPIVVVVVGFPVDDALEIVPVKLRKQGWGENRTGCLEIVEPVDGCSWEGGEVWSFQKLLLWDCLGHRSLSRERLELCSDGGGNLIDEFPKRVFSVPRYI